tara:strand:- start:445 stop:813 length:369 start_codon:yes stop_codon:yes gene_type:complete
MPQLSPSLTVAQVVQAAGPGLFTRVIVEDIYTESFDDENKYTPLAWTASHSGDGTTALESLWVKAVPTMPEHYVEHVRASTTGITDRGTVLVSPDSLVISYRPLPTRGRSRMTPTSFNLGQR